MTSPEETLRFPTLSEARISPIESPSAKGMYSLYGDIVLEMMSYDEPVDDLSRACASKLLNSKFFENPEAQYGAEISLQGVTALFTHDPTMIRESFEAETGRMPEEGDELPDTIGFALSGLEQVQGFFGTFTTGPIIDIESKYGSYLDFSFCVNIENPLITTPSTGIGEQPDFMVGSWLAVLGPESKIGTVS